MSLLTPEPEAKKRIFIVEDEGIVASDIEINLRDLGYEVTGVAVSGEDAIRQIAARVPDLVLMDIRLQGTLDGIETAKHLRDHLDPAIIFLTAHGDRDTLERAKQLEPLAFLIKPFKKTELFSAIEIALYRHAMRRLRQAEQRSELERLQREHAEQRVRERDEFMAVAAHELRTPLSALQLRLQGLQLQISRDALLATNGPWLEAQLAGALRQTRRLGNLIGQLMDVARIVAGRLDLSPERFDLAHLVRSVLDDFREQARLAHCEIHPVLTGDAFGVWDKARLEQAVVNLLSNALKYGGGKPVDVALTAVDNEVSFSVTDRGIGISEEDRHRIFERFERAVPTRQFGGLGLGLYITRHVVEAHGGQIQVDSTLGEGSTFQIRLPKHTPQVGGG